MLIILLLCLFAGAARMTPYVPLVLVVLGGILDQVFLQPQREKWWAEVGLEREVTLQVLIVSLAISLVMAYAAFLIGRGLNALYRRWASPRS